MFFFIDLLASKVYLTKNGCLKKFWNYYLKAGIVFRNLNKYLTKILITSIAYYLKYKSDRFINMLKLLMKNEIDITKTAHLLHVSRRYLNNNIEIFYH